MNLYCHKGYCFVIEDYMDEPLNPEPCFTSTCCPSRPIRQRQVLFHLRILTCKKHPKSLLAPALTKNTNIEIWVVGTSN